MSPSSSGSWRGRWDPARQCRSSRSRPDWSAAWTGCPRTSPSGCTSATATTATSTSSSPSRSSCRWASSTLSVSGAQRPVDWASFTVPQARDDADYFAPLRDLAAGPETELYFALVPYHPDDQAEGTTAAQARHIDTALAESSAGGREWGICTECGMGRVDAEDVPTLLDLHREILTT